jgi:hypothetical protein
MTPCQHCPQSFTTEAMRDTHTQYVHPSEDYVSLGFDGLGYIATVDCTREEARRVTESLPTVSDVDWQRFTAEGKRE